MKEVLPPAPALRAGYYFTDDAAQSHKGWSLVFPMESLWESPYPLGDHVGDLILLTRRQWETYTTPRAWQSLGVASFADYYAALSATRAKTTSRIMRAEKKSPFPSSTRRYIQGNLLLLESGWRAGARYELYVFSSEGAPAGEKGYRHSLTTKSMTLVSSGTLPTDADSGSCPNP